MENVILDFKNVSINISGIQILRNSSFQVEKGNVTLIQGENGSGKSSIVKTILKTLKYDSGEIYYHGEIYNTQKDIANMRKRISYVSQDDELFFCTTVYDCIRFNYINSLNYDENDAFELKLDLLLNKFDFSVYRNRRIKTLSGGEKRIVSIIACLIQDTDLYIIDEPINNLDHKRARVVGDYLYDLAKEKEVGVLLITHCRMNMRATKAYLIEEKTIKELDKVPPMCRER